MQSEKSKEALGSITFETQSNCIRSFIEEYCLDNNIKVADMFNKHRRKRKYSIYKCELTYMILERGWTVTEAAQALKCDRKTVQYRAWAYATDNKLPHVVNAYGVKKRPDVERLGYAWFHGLKTPSIIIKRANGDLEWNEYMDTMLKQLDDDGLSQSKIACLMSDVMGVSLNVNQISGRRTRLGLRRCD